MKYRIAWQSTSGYLAPALAERAARGEGLPVNFNPHAGHGEFCFPDAQRANDLIQGVKARALPGDDRVWWAESEADAEAWAAGWIPSKAVEA